MRKYNVDGDLAMLARDDACTNFCGADIFQWIENAGHITVGRSENTITKNDLLKARERMLPSVKDPNYWRKAGEALIKVMTRG